jgi:hypothetical protein
VSRPAIRVVAREAPEVKPIDLRAWVYAYVATVARQEGITPPPNGRPPDPLSCVPAYLQAYSPVHLRAYKYGRGYVGHG